MIKWWENKQTKKKEYGGECRERICGVKRCTRARERNKKKGWGFTNFQEVMIYNDYDDADDADEDDADAVYSEWW